MDEAELSQLNEKQIIERILSGQVQYYGCLVKRYWNVVLALALTRCPDPNAAEDIAQESFIKAYHHLSDLRNPSCFAGWLTKIVRQECISHYRSRMRDKTAIRIAGLNWKPLAANTNPGLSKEQIAFIHETIRKLPGRFRNVVILRFIGGFSIRQIAEQLGKKCGTVRVWLHRAYNLLREELAPILEEVQL